MPSGQKAAMDSINPPESIHIYNNDEKSSVLSGIINIIAHRNMNGIMSKRNHRFVVVHFTSNLSSQRKI